MQLKLFALLWPVLLCSSFPGSLCGAQSQVDLPYRVLVIIGSQWADPGSYSIDGSGRLRNPSRESGKDFRDVITMLKIWGIPFDILRLDQQKLQINRFLNGVAEPNYSCLVWMANPEELRGLSANYETLRRAVEEYRIGLIALFDYVANQEVASLIGVEYQSLSNGPAQAVLRLSGKHFLTENLPNETVEDNTTSDLRIVQCRVRSGSSIVATLEGQPQVVVREISDQTKVTWIGGGRDWLGRFPEMRQLFRKALIYTMGYGLFNDSFENTFIFIMDDMGASEHAYSLRWHYPTPSREQIIKYLVKPLEESGFIMVQNVTPGYANPLTRMVENPWTVEPFTDPFGNRQDYGSTKQGLDEGVRRGVFEIHAHRAWTHKNWDLDSLPGPWWDGPIEGERAHSDWYQETYDARRGQPVPSNDMLFIYKVGRDAIERQFGVAPLAVTVRPGVSLDHDNGRLAAIAGYGVDRQHYIGTDYVIQFSIPELYPEQITCHDLDLVPKGASEITEPHKNLQEESTDALKAARVVGERRIDFRSRQWLESKKDKRWIGFDEYCAYLHSKVNASRDDGLRIVVTYDPYYCRHFAKHTSSWTLEVSPQVQAELGTGAAILVDGETLTNNLSQRQTAIIRAGVGSHTLSVLAE